MRLEIGKNQKEGMFTIHCKEISYSQCPKTLRVRADASAAVLRSMVSFIQIIAR